MVQIHLNSVEILMVLVVAQLELVTVVVIQERPHHREVAHII
jgi:hypothetical protein